MFAIVLAGGMGKRMKSALPKVLHKVCGKPMILHILGQLFSLKEIEKTIVVIGYKRDLVKKALPKWAKTAVQKKMLGTGDAVKSAAYHFKNYDGDILVLCGDTPLIRAATLKSIVGIHKKELSKVTIVTAKVTDPANYGRIIRNKKGEAVGIVEEKSATAQQKKIKEINTGIYCFDSKMLYFALGKIKKNKIKGEYYLTDAIQILKRKGCRIGTVLVKDAREVMGIDDPSRLKSCQEYLKKQGLGSRRK